VRAVGTAAVGVGAVVGTATVFGTAAVFGSAAVVTATAAVGDGIIVGVGAVVGAGVGVRAGVGIVAVVRDGAVAAVAAVVGLRYLCTTSIGLWHGRHVREMPCCLFSPTHLSLVYPFQMWVERSSTHFLFPYGYRFALLFGSCKTIPIKHTRMGTKSFAGNHY
jgi:hypothetical protein